MTYVINLHRLCCPLQRTSIHCRQQQHVCAIPDYLRCSWRLIKRLCSTQRRATSSKSVTTVEMELHRLLHYLYHLMETSQRLPVSPVAFVSLSSKMKVQERVVSSAVHSPHAAAKQMARYLTVTEAAETAGAVDAVDFCAAIDRARTAPSVHLLKICLLLLRHRRLWNAFFALWPVAVSCQT